MLINVCLVSMNSKPVDVTKGQDRRVLAVDLDGTLLRSDMLYESIANVMHRAALGLLRLPFWLAKGKAHVKQELARRSQIDVTSLPYNEDVLQLIRDARDKGDLIVLCTATDQDLAKRIAAHLDLFDEVMASDGICNLGADAKAQALIARFGEKGFSYAGNSRADFPVWQVARKAIVVNSSAKFAASVSKLCEVEQILSPGPLGLREIASALRVHQWLKNVLIFVPLLASHQVFDLGLWRDAFAAFLAFSLCASSVYIINDFIDLESDRLHPRKSRRAFASGRVPLLLGFVMAFGFAVIGLGIAVAVGGYFPLILLSYLLITTFYSTLLKRIVLIDCLTLGGLYTLRVVAGSEASVEDISSWLLGFSFFLFLSLSYVKRYAEMLPFGGDPGKQIPGRGYNSSDTPIVAMLGVGSGYAAVVVLALYLNSETVRLLYETPQILTGTVPILLFWISWIWLRANRGEMHDDPVIFAIRDSVSRWAGLVFGVIIVLGAMDPPW